VNGRTERKPPLSTAAVALALSTPLLARLRPARLRRLLALLAGPPFASADPRKAAAATASVERSLAVVARVWPQTCLTRGVTRYVLLSRAGLPIEPVFGLGPIDGLYAGHCWLELGDEPYLEKEDPRAAFPEIFRVSRATPPL
jgi:Transglutaminase-like superfamily